MFTAGPVQIRSSSAPLSPSLHQEFLDRFNLPLIQAMGSSEAGNGFSNPAPPGRNKIGSPGRPWGYELRVLDLNGGDSPTGEPGEVLIRGDGMMQGCGIGRSRRCILRCRRCMAIRSRE